jgi:hypothetical protein
MRLEAMSSNVKPAHFQQRRLARPHITRIETPGEESDVR